LRGSATKVKRLLPDLSHGSTVIEEEKTGSAEKTALIDARRADASVGQVQLIAAQILGCGCPRRSARGRR